MNTTPREEQVVADIEEWLQLAKIPYIRHFERRPFNGKFYGKPSTAGVSDLIGYVPYWRNPDGFTIPLYIEVKRAKGSTTSAAQMAFIETCKQDLCIAFFAHSREEVIDHLGFEGVDVNLATRRPDHE